MTERGVVVTGIGAVTPYGVGRKEFWENIAAGASAAALITSFDVSSLPTQFVAGALAIGNQINPPTSNYQEPNRDCNLD